MKVYCRKRRGPHSVDRLANQESTPTELMTLLRVLSRNHALIYDTQRLMEETLSKLVDNKISGQQNGHKADSVSDKANPHATCSRPSMQTFPPRTEVSHEGRQPTFEEAQEQLKEDWKNANLEDEIFYKDYAKLRMQYSRGRNR